MSPIRRMDARFRGHDDRSCASIHVAAYSKGKHHQARKFPEKLAGGPLTLGSLLSAIREGEGMTQADVADTLGVSRSHLCDIEKGRKTVGPARAARFATILGHSPESFVALALQAQVQEAGLKLTVTVEAA